MSCTFTHYLSHDKEISFLSLLVKQCKEQKNVNPHETKKKKGVLLREVFMQGGSSTWANV
jgi:hypothetical protein